MPVDAQKKIENIKLKSELLTASVPMSMRSMPRFKEANEILQAAIELAEIQNKVIDELMRDRFPECDRAGLPSLEELAENL